MTFGISHAFVRALFRTAGGRTGNVHADALATTWHRPLYIFDYWQMGGYPSAPISSVIHSET
jgi:hypothetical protein